VNINYAPGANLLRGMRAQDDFSYSIIETPISEGGDTTPAVVQDSNVNHFEGTQVQNNFRISVQDSALVPGHSFVNNTPAIVTCDSLGNVVRLQDGNADIGISTPVGKRKYTRTMGISASADINYWHSFVAGSLGKHIIDSMLALVTGKTRSNTTTDVFLSNNYNLVSPAAVRNPNLFAASVDLSAISIANANYTGGVTYSHPGLLISPRHIIGAAHYIAIGPIVWMDQQGGYHTASPISYQSINGTDIVVQYLDTPVTGITPFSTLPSNWISYLPTTDADLIHNLPCLTKIIHAASGTRDTLAVNHFWRLRQYYGGAAWTASPREYENIAALETEAWQGAISGGDSGGPLFFVINGELCIIGTYYTAFYSATIPDYIAGIEAAMNSLAQAQGDFTAYALDKVDLSAFTSY
jgi:hypothetical protein